MVQDDRKDDPAAGSYEHSDARFGPLALSGFALLALMSVGMLLSRRILESFKVDDEVGPQHPMSAFRQGPAGPLLQADPHLDLAAHEAWEDRVLTEYAWIDPVGGVVQLPIARAMQLALEEGFPLPASTELPDAEGAR